MTLTEHIIIVSVIAAVTLITRLFPFLLFKKGRSTPKFLQYLGESLAPALFAMLVIYCLKDVQFLSTPHGLPELCSILVIVVIHIIFRKTLVSISVGTALYLILVNLVF